MATCGICGTQCDDQGRCPKHWSGIKPSIHVHANFDRMQPETEAALGRMIALAVEAIQRGDFDEPPSPTPESDAP